MFGLRSQSLVRWGTPSFLYAGGRITYNCLRTGWDCPYTVVCEMLVHFVLDAGTDYDCGRRVGNDPKTVRRVWPEAQEVPVVCVTGSSLLR